MFSLYSRVLLIFNSLLEKKLKRKIDIKAIIQIDIFFKEILFITVSPIQFYEKKCNYIHFIMRSHLILIIQQRH